MHHFSSYFSIQILQTFASVLDAMTKHYGIRFFPVQIALDANTGNKNSLLITHAHSKVSFLKSVSCCSRQNSGSPLGLFLFFNMVSFKNQTKAIWKHEVGKEIKLNVEKVK